MSARRAEAWITVEPPDGVGEIRQAETSPGFD